MPTAINTRGGRPTYWTDARIEQRLSRFLAGRSAWPTRAEFVAAGLGRLHATLEKRRALGQWAGRFGLPAPRRGRRRTPGAGISLCSPHHLFDDETDRCTRCGVHLYDGQTDDVGCGAPKLNPQAYGGLALTVPEQLIAAHDGLDLSAAFSRKPSQVFDGADSLSYEQMGARVKLVERAALEAASADAVVRALGEETSQ